MKAAVIGEEVFDRLDGPVLRVATPDATVPYSQPSEVLLLLKVSDVMITAREPAFCRQWETPGGGPNDARRSSKSCRPT